MRPRTSASRALVWLSILVILGFAFAACGDDGGGGGGDGNADAGDATADRDTTTTGAPGPGGSHDPTATVRLGWTGSLSGWDTHKSRNAQSDFPYLSLVYDRLLELSLDGEIVPGLAEAWQLSDDGRTLTLTLRDGVSFNDGSPLDANAVKANLERAKTLDGSTVAGQLRMVESVDVTDSSTVVLELSENGSTLPHLLAYQAGFIMNPAAFAQPDMLEPNGSGPYVFDAASSNQVTYVFRGTDDYWNDDVPVSAGFEIWQLGDDNARLNALRTGQIDIAIVKAGQLPDVESLDGNGFRLHKYDTSSHISLYLDTSRPGLDDPRVRRALDMAIDRETINQQLLSGACRPSAQLFGRGQPGYDDALTDPPAFDPDRARTLLADAGVTNLSFDVLAGSGLEPHSTIADVLEQQFRDIGVSIELKKIPPAEVRPTFRSGGAGGMVSTVVPGFDPAITLATSYFGADSPGGVPAEVQSLIEQASAAQLGSDDRAEALRAINEALYEEPVHILVCQPVNMWLAADDVLGADTMPLANLASFTDPHLLAIAQS